MGCLAAYCTHVQSCDVTRVQSATQWTASVQTSHQDVMQYRGRLFTGRHVTSGRHMQELPWTRSVTSRHVTSGRHRRRCGQGGRHVTSRQDVTGAAVDKEAVTSRHVTSGHHRRRRGQGCRNAPTRHVTSRHVTSRRQAPPERTMLLSLFGYRGKKSSWCCWVESQRSWWMTSFFDV